MTEKKNEDNEDRESQISQKEYPFPYYVGFILGNEFCERYANTGIRAILTIFLYKFIGFDKDISTIMYHLFECCAYFCSLIGAALADGYWGKFNTIFRLSLVYAFGMCIFALSAIPFDDGSSTFRGANAALVGAALIVVSFGTGGIKPCVSSFGGDQFEADDKKGTQAFFDLFYWMINAGSFISLFITPILRTTSCGSLGTDDSCFFLAYATPAALFLIATGLFLFGSKYYIKKPPSGTNIFVDTLAVIWYGTWNKIPSDSPVQDNWLYGAWGKKEEWIIRDTKYLVRVLVMFLPICIFWSAFDQQGSRWVLQAACMNGYIGSGSFSILPDQTQILNPIFILSFIPIFNWMYGIFDKCFGKGFVTSLRKINVGMVFALVAYLIAAFVQGMIDVNLTTLPTIESEISLKVVNLLDGTISGDFESKNGKLPDELTSQTVSPFTIESGSYSQLPEQNDDGNSETEYYSTAEVLVETVDDTTDGVSEYSFNYTADNFDSTANWRPHEIGPYQAPFQVTEGRQVWTVALFPDGNSVTYAGWGDKDTDGKSHMIVVSAMQKDIVVKFECVEGSTCGKQKEVNATLSACEFDANVKHLKSNRGRGLLVNSDENDVDDGDDDQRNLMCVQGSVLEPDSDRITLIKGTYTVITEGLDTDSFEIEIGTGAGYTIAITENGSITVQQDINSNDVSMLWIIPQFFVITVAEVLISITGIEFAYSQAPVTLKSVLTAWWLMTVAVGNIVVIIVAETRILPTQVGEYLLFAGMIAVSNVIFFCLSVWYYEYVKPGEFDDFVYPETMNIGNENKAIDEENDDKEDKL